MDPFDAMHVRSLIAEAVETACNRDLKFTDFRERYSKDYPTATTSTLISNVRDYRTVWPLNTRIETRR